ncbi:ABC transporter permease subunit [Fusibacter paucivorans]|uniref:ABC transporter permease subunit n=1 Tax=Fusibacter paucivorans TaxID=76009 RepID=A0ABS5PPZ9_9FIRM|nr:ABC transporter permease subunit [Fusibacter paucivorans]MBS7526474.1 ABC transporter permease subunit [Fusibacter paucivorans]
MRQKRLALYSIIFITITLSLAWVLFSHEDRVTETGGHPSIYALIDADKTTRQVGTEGHAVFENALLETMASSGLKPDGENYVQDFDMIGISYDEAPTFMIHTDSETLDFEIMSDYQTYYNQYSGAINYTGDMLFLESSFYSTTPALLSGKIVVTKFNQLTDEIVAYARENGVRGLMIMEDTPQREQLYFNPYFGQKRADDLYLAKITKETYAALKAMAIERPLEGTAKSGPVSGRISNVTLKVGDAYPVLTGHNIVGKIKGTGHGRPIVFYTYYDSIGYYLGDRYQNVMQRLTGVSALSEMIKYAAEIAQKPAGDVYFAFVDGGSSSDAGVANLLKQMPEGSEFIEIGVMGFAGSSDVNIGYRSANNNGNKFSAILASKVSQYLETSDVVLGETDILNTDGSSYLLNQSVPSIILTQNINMSTMSHIMAQDRIDMMDIDAYQRGVDALKGLLSQAYFKPRDLNYMPYQLRVIVFLLWLTIGLAAIVSVGKHMTTGILVRMYRSTLYQLLLKALIIIVPTVIMLILMLFILLVPNDITKADYGGQYTNYVFSLHIRRMIYYVMQLVGNSASYLTPALKTALYVGFLETLKRFLATVTISGVAGLLIGMHRGLKKRTFGDLVVLILYAIPDVLISLLGIYTIIVLVKHGWLGPFTPETMRMTVMPIIVMCVVPMIYIIRIIQMETERLMAEPFIMGEIARGVPRKRILWHHVLPMLITYLLTSMASILRLIMVNLLVVEYLYACVGVGAYLIINRYDPTYVLLISVILGLMFIAANTFFRILNNWFDPMRRQS